MSMIRILVQSFLFSFMITVGYCEAWAMSLRFIDVFEETDRAKPRGGFSAIHFEPQSGILTALSDVAEPKPILFTYKFKINDGKISLTATGSSHLEAPKGRLDPEGLVRVGSRWVLSSEGHFKDDTGQINFIDYPAVHIYEARKGSFAFSYIPSDKLQRSSIPNMTLEALAFDEKTEYLYSGMENPLLFDGLPVSFQNGGYVRIFRGKLQLNGYQSEGEYAYWIEPIPGDHSASQQSGVHGLTEMVVYKNHLLLLQRSFDTESFTNHIQIFSVPLNAFEAKRNINAYDSLASLRLLPEKQRPNIEFLKLPKKLIFNLSQIVSKLPGKRLDNFEGMCLGPKLENGHATLILVSDDNFRKAQKTLFLAFEIVP